jgi:hypothetical protein
LFASSFIYPARNTKQRYRVSIHGKIRGIHPFTNNNNGKVHPEKGCPALVDKNLGLNSRAKI